MTLEEAIKHANEVAEEKKEEACNLYDDKNYEESRECIWCAEEHRQLAEWLNDYKRLLEQEPILNKIRAEVEAYQSDAFYPDDVMMNRRMVLEIIDKYREESDCRECKVEHDCYECEKYKTLEQEPQTGYWIEVIDEIDSLGNKTWHYKCSICGNENSGWGAFKYCPDCGTKMEVVSKQK